MNATENKKLTGGLVLTPFVSAIPLHCILEHDSLEPTRPNYRNKVLNIYKLVQMVSKWLLI